MSCIRIPTRGPDDWRPLLADPDKHWRRGYSAMATALSWEAAEGLPPEIEAMLGPGAELLLAMPEHKVPLPGGWRESQCDVFALVRVGPDLLSLSVEAKVHEPFGPTLAEWMATPSPGRQTRLQFLCDMLGLVEPPGTIRYQLLHRTVAAIVEARRFKADRAAMVVQSFAANRHWYADFAALAALFGPPPDPGEALTVTLPSGLLLTLGWAVGEAQFL